MNAQDVTPTRNSCRIGTKMSSSLKARLKKCGRYHPGTPTLPCSAPTPPATLHDSCGENISSSAGATSIHSHSVENSCATPKRRLHDRRLASGSFATKDSKSKTKLIEEPESLCEFNMKRPTMKVSLCLDSNVNNERVRAMNIKNRQLQLDPSSSSQHSTSIVMDQESPVVKTIPSSNPPILGEENPPSLSSCFDSGSQNTEDLLLQVKALETQLKLKEETLRKLKMVKMYREKNNLTELQELIDKWRDVSQKALVDLSELQPSPRPSMTELISHLLIDPDLVRYNVEEEGFV